MSDIDKHSRSRSVTLPQALRYRRLRNLEIGETAWTRSIAMRVDDDYRCWLTLGSAAVTARTSEFDLHCTRLEKGWHVDATNSIHRWRNRGNFEDTDERVAPVISIEPEGTS